METSRASLWFALKPEEEGGTEGTGEVIWQWGERGGHHVQTCPVATTPPPPPPPQTELHRDDKKQRWLVKPFQILI